jgi:hypothetical protein
MTPTSQSEYRRGNGAVKETTNFVVTPFTVHQRGTAICGATSFLLIRGYDRTDQLVALSAQVVAALLQ